MFSDLRAAYRLYNPNLESMIKVTSMRESNPLNFETDCYLRYNYVPVLVFIDGKKFTMHFSKLNTNNNLIALVEVS